MCPTTMASLLRHNTNYGGYSQGSTGIHSRPLVHLPALLLLAVSSRVTASIASEPSVCSTGETSDSTKHTHTHTARYRWAHKQTDTGVRRHVALTEPINKVAFDHVSCLVYSDNTTFFLKYITADATSWTSFSEMTSMSCGQTPYFKILPSMPNHWPLVFEILCSTECTVTFRCHIQHKLGVTVHRCLQGKAPQYLIECCTPTSEVASGSVLPAAINSLCHVTIAASSAVGRSLLLVRSSVTHCLITAGTQCSALIVSSHAWRHTCFRCIRHAAH